MAEVVQTGESSREYVAYLLLKMINEAEDNPRRTRRQILDLYAECIMAIRNPAQRGKAALERRGKAAQEIGKAAQETEARP
jgi:hypothetical protein